jgi:RNA polymerase sigma factor (TIGR02999 family)
MEGKSKQGPMGDKDHEFDAKLYHDLRRLAAYYMKMERKGHTLQPTALVHEAILRVYGGVVPEQLSQKQIIATLARAMRRVLVDHARHRSAAKRTDSEAGTAFKDEIKFDESYRAAVNVLTIDEAISELHEANERYAQVVELRYFAGMTEEETAEVLNVSRETVKRDWRFGRAWLKQRLCRNSKMEAGVRSLPATVGETSSTAPSAH